MTVTPEELVGGMLAQLKSQAEAKFSQDVSAWEQSQRTLFEERVAAGKQEIKRRAAGRPEGVFLAQQYELRARRRFEEELAAEKLQMRRRFEEEWAATEAEAKSKLQLSAEFWIKIGYPEYAGKYAPVELPEGAVVTGVTETSSGISLEYKTREQLAAEQAIQEETLRSIRQVQEQAQLSAEFWTKVGFPEYAGKYAPVSLPEGAQISSVKETATGLEVSYVTREQQRQLEELKKTQEASVSFWTGLGFPEYAGKYAPIELPEGAVVTGITEAEGRLNIEYTVPSQSTVQAPEYIGFDPQLASLRNMLIGFRQQQATANLAAAKTQAQQVNPLAQREDASRAAETLANVQVDVAKTFTAAQTRQGIPIDSPAGAWTLESAGPQPRLLPAPGLQGALSAAYLTNFEMRKQEILAEQHAEIARAGQQAMEQFSEKLRGSLLPPPYAINTPEYSNYMSRQKAYVQKATWEAQQQLRDWRQEQLQIAEKLAAEQAKAESRELAMAHLAGAAGAAAFAAAPAAAAVGAIFNVAVAQGYKAFQDQGLLTVPELVTSAGLGATLGAAQSWLIGQASKIVPVMTERGLAASAARVSTLTALGAATGSGFGAGEAMLSGADVLQGAGRGAVAGAAMGLAFGVAGEVAAGIIQPKIAAKVQAALDKSYQEVAEFNMRVLRSDMIAETPRLWTPTLAQRIGMKLTGVAGPKPLATGLAVANVPSGDVPYSMADFIRQGVAADIWELGFAPKSSAYIMYSPKPAGAAVKPASKLPMAPVMAAWNEFKQDLKTVEYNLEMRQRLIDKGIPESQLAVDYQGPLSFKRYPNVLEYAEGKTVGYAWTGPFQEQPRAPMKPLITTAKALPESTLANKSVAVTVTKPQTAVSALPKIDVATSAAPKLTGYDPTKYLGAAYPLARQRRTREEDDTAYPLSYPTLSPLKAPGLESPLKQPNVSILKPSVQPTPQQLNIRQSVIEALQPQPLKASVTLQPKTSLGAGTAVVAAPTVAPSVAGEQRSLLASSSALSLRMPSQDVTKPTVQLPPPPQISWPTSPPKPAVAELPLRSLPRGLSSRSPGFMFIRRRPITSEREQLQRSLSAFSKVSLGDVAKLNPQKLGINMRGSRFKLQATIDVLPRRRRGRK